MNLPQHAAAIVVHRDRGGLQRDDATPQRIRERGTLRVGYDASNLPFSFFNADGQLVGLDVELGVALAEALGAKAEFVPVSWSELTTVVADGLIDVMPGVWYRPYWFAKLRLSEPYHVGTMGIVVRDERRHEFASVETLRRSEGLRIGVPLDASQVASSIARYFGKARVELVPLPTAASFFEGRHHDLDGYLMPAEGASAWTLLHSEYTIVVPQPNPVKIPTAFGLPMGARDLTDAVDEWVVFATSEGKVQRAYDLLGARQGRR